MPDPSGERYAQARGILITASPLAFAAAIASIASNDWIGRDARFSMRAVTNRVRLAGTTH
jgi:hypothetical protein